MKAITPIKRRIPFTTKCTATSFTLWSISICIEFHESCQKKDADNTPAWVWPTPNQQHIIFVSKMNHIVMQFSVELLNTVIMATIVETTTADIFPHFIHIYALQANQRMGAKEEGRER